MSLASTVCRDHGPIINTKLMNSWLQDNWTILETGIVMLLYHARYRDQSFDALHM